MNKTTQQPTVRRCHDVGQAKVVMIDKLNAMASYHATSSEVSEALMSLRCRFKLTNAQWAYLDGYADAVRQEWYHTKLIYCAVWKDKVIPMKWDNLPEAFREYIRKGGKYTSGHYWVNECGPITKPYFVGAE